jgi:hypothetical protein
MTTKSKSSKWSQRRLEREEVQEHLRAALHGVRGDAGDFFEAITSMFEIIKMDLEEDAASYTPLRAAVLDAAANAAWKAAVAVSPPGKRAP